MRGLSVNEVLEFVPGANVTEESSLTDEVNVLITWGAVGVEKQSKMDARQALKGVLRVVPSSGVPKNSKLNLSQELQHFLVSKGAQIQFLIDCH